MNRYHLRIACMMLACLLISRVAVGQNTGYKFESLSVSSGESTITSGITGIAQFTKNKTRLIEIAVQQEQAWLIYGSKFKSGKRFNGLAAASGGHFKGAPWVGPFLALEAPIASALGQQITVSTMQWPGFFLYRPKERDRNGSKPDRFLDKTMGYLGGAQLAVGPLGFGYSLQKFLDDPWNELPAVSYTKKISKDFSVSGSATWNNNDRHWMYYLGLTWKPA